MAEHNQTNETDGYIAAQRKAGHNDPAIIETLVQNGWDRNAAAAAVNGGSNVPPPPPPAQPAPVNQYSQSGNAGVPLQVENVAYNMRMRPVESKIGLYMRFTNWGLWISVFAVCGFFATIVGRIAGSDSDLGVATALAFSFSAIAVPIFIIANKKRNAELDTNPALIDDIFYKRSIRQGLGWAIGLTAVSTFFMLYGFLSLLFLNKDPDSSDTATPFQAFIYALGFGAALYFYWLQHARTRR